MEVEGKAAVVSGGASGIGRAARSLTVDIDKRTLQLCREKLFLRSLR